MPTAPPIALALYQPDIANNTGALLRLGACLALPVHVIHPTGFAFSRASLRRAGLDYVARATLIEHSSYGAFLHWCRSEARRIVLLSTRAKASAYGFAFAPGDVLMVGRESAGVPDTVAHDADAAIRIPMAAGERSLNVALAAAMMVGEARRQTDRFEGLS